MKLKNEPGTIVKYDSISYLQKHTRSRTYGTLREREDLVGTLTLFHLGVGDYAHSIGLSPLNSKVFCRACFQYIYLVSN